MTQPQDDRVGGAVVALLEDDAPRIARRMLENLTGALTARGVPAGYLDAVYAHCLDHVRAWVTVLREDRALTDAELAFVDDHAALRARQGVALEDLQGAYLTARQALYHALVEASARSGEGMTAALVLGARSMGHADRVLARFTRVHTEVLTELREGSDALVSDALARALSGGDIEIPGIGPAELLVVVVCAPDDPWMARADLHRAAAGLTRRALALAGRDAAVAVVPLAGRDAGALRAAVAERMLTGRCRAGIGTPRRGAANLAQGWAEARLALRSARPGEVRSLGDAEAVHGEITLDPRTVAVLARDRDAGGTLAAAVLALFDAGGDPAAAASALGIPPVSLAYRTAKAARLTRLDPARPGDLLALAIAALMRRTGAGQDCR